jgi:hypothetical protein
MQSNESDEIICSNCGRPNLPEAVKCWYCQSPLSKDTSADFASDEFESPEIPEEKLSRPKEKKAPPQEAIEDVPEWLKRIRDKEKKDREAEEALNQWQQQDFFSSPQPAKTPSPVQKKSTSRPESKDPEKAAGVEKDKQEIEKEKIVRSIQSAQDAAPVEEPVEKEPDIIQENEEDETEDNLGDQTDELPDGFIKFDSKSQ